jgi:hypothetical protein
MSTKPRRRAAHRRPRYAAGGPVPGSPDVALPAQPYLDPSHTGGLPLINPNHLGGLTVKQNLMRAAPAPPGPPMPAGPSITPAAGRRNYGKTPP